MYPQQNPIFPSVFGIPSVPPAIEAAHGTADSSGAFEKQTADPAVGAPGR